MIKLIKYHGPEDDIWIGPIHHVYGIRIGHWYCALHIRTNRYNEWALKERELFHMSTTAKRAVFLTWKDKDPACYNSRTLWEES